MNGTRFIISPASNEKERAAELKVGRQPGLLHLYQDDIYTLRLSIKNFNNQVCVGAHALQRLWSRAPCV